MRNPIFFKNRVKTGTALSYTLTVSNAGPQTASNVQLVDRLPSGVSTDWSCNEASGTVTCELVWLSVRPVLLLLMSSHRVRLAISLTKLW
ncbi:MAG: hypothetical protein DRR08_19350 [Candidatus Parabeggiatoa sp. nov. 2]|nr:MAG: hypothetical protein DRR08_19350 [Gammaproteobacteria bacterium]